jgi:hypothetical protein
MIIVNNCARCGKDQEPVMVRFIPSPVETDEDVSDVPDVSKSMQRETLINHMMRLACSEHEDAGARIAAAQLLVNMGAV